eukprot:scpid58437/ scgid18115/ 
MERIASRGAGSASSKRSSRTNPALDIVTDLPDEGSGMVVHQPMPMVMANPLYFDTQLPASRLAWTNPMEPRCTSSGCVWPGKAPLAVATEAPLVAATEASPVVAEQPLPSAEAPPAGETPPAAESQRETGHEATSVDGNAEENADIANPVADSPEHEATRTESVHLSLQVPAVSFLHGSISIKPDDFDHDVDMEEQMMHVEASGLSTEQQAQAQPQQKGKYENWWASEIFDCGNNVDICMWGLLCPWYLLFKISHILDNNKIDRGENHRAARAQQKPLGYRMVRAVRPVFYILCCFLGHLFLRKRVRDRFSIQGSLKNDCIVTCLCGLCAGCQEAREVQQLGISVGNQTQTIDKGKLPPFYLKKLRHDAITKSDRKIVAV